MTAETKSGLPQVPGGEALRESEERYRRLIETASEGIMMGGLDGRITFANKKISDMLGYSIDELVGKIGLDFMPDDQKEKVIAARAELAKKNNVQIEVCFLRKDGSRLWTIGSYAAILDNNGIHIGNLAMYTDITERKKAEQALRESEARFRSSLDNMIEGCQILDRQWRYVYINDAAERQNRRPKAELIGNRYMDMWPGIETTRVFEVIRRCLEQGKSDTFENEFTFPDGNIGWFDLITQPVPEGVFILSMDVTARKRSEAALLDAKAQKKAAQYSRTLIEVSLDPLVTISAEGKITDVNEATVRATGIPREGLIGTDFSSYFTEPQKASQGYRQVFDQGSVTDYPLTIRHKNGSIRHVLYNAAVYKDESGNVLGVFAAARDVTARMRAEEELAAHQRRLEKLVTARTAELEVANKDLRGSRRAALNLLKDAIEARRAIEQAELGLRLAAEDLSRSNKDLEQFAYVASHDLQEPLRAVGGFMGMLKNQYYDKLDDQAREYINFSVDGAERMQSLIEGLLTFSRVGTRGGEFASVDIKDALDGALANLKTLVAESNAVVGSDPLPVVNADPFQMTQLFQNLVANAIKFHGSRPPEVHVGAQRRERAWEIYVRDNGIGIDPQYFDRIFLIFQRLHTRSQYKGTGIGLAVCKKIVERHGGTIWVESVPGEGSTFYFTIPDKGEKA